MQHFSARNDHTDEFPAYLFDGSFKNLRTVYLAWQNIYGALPDFSPSAQNISLLVLDFVGNNLGLDANGNQLPVGGGGDIPSSLSQHSSIIIADLRWNSFVGEIPQTGWGEHFQTRFLGFANNNLTGPIPDVLPNSPDLQYLYFGNNNLSGTISMDGAKYGDSSAYPRFKYIDIAGNKFQESDYSSLLSELGSDKLRVGQQNPDDGGSTDSPSVPQLSSPSDGATNISVTPVFEWGAVDADSYQIEVQNLSTSSTVISTSVTGTTFTPSNPLAYGTSYRWRVRSVRRGVASSWSTYLGFTTEEDPNNGGGGTATPDAPALRSPTDGSIDVALAPQFSWSSVDADYYILHVSGSNPSEMVLEEQVNDTSFTPSVNLSEGRNHQWRVRGVKDGVEGTWSPIWSFTTLENSGNNGKGPQKITPAKDEKNTSKKQKFEWQSVEGADAYEIEVTSVEEQQVVIDEIVTDTTYTPGQDFQPNHRYEWRVRAIINGQAEEWGDSWAFTTGDDVLATKVELEQNYPNPFNPSTNIRFALTQQQEVSLKVYDMAGRLVATLLNGELLGAGPYSVTFDAQSMASGIYFYRIITPREVVTRKMTLMK
ncbi:T9SS type A sorting domain-containing protein [Rhodohalobacter mucosus]|nr:T9SS type A sorting domain-containing protein [Rhodohalobacter mucosus]